MVRITIIVMTMIFTKLMTYPSRLGDDKRSETTCILESLRRSVNETTRNLTGWPAKFRTDYHSSMFYGLFGHQVPLF